ncbi:DUF4190 domain-containing protein [Haloechinothrix sp. LS1_15]|uniref:DUF4190 domain-containing protein n=1 Tax=Haloechinothrix sp. LS1_15 TaxID=2652248 RepID=UPI00294B403E|nr:DUF4190 domain-containing protein [Haloechinothrix sp. LS1_15]
MTEAQQAPMPTQEPRNGFGITALVLALIGLVLGLVPFTGFIALILGALAVLFGFLGWGRARRGTATNTKMSVIGSLLGAGAIALGIWGMTIVFGAVEELSDELEEIGVEMERQLDESEAEFQERMDCIEAVDLDAEDYQAQIDEC